MQIRKLVAFQIVLLLLLSPIITMSVCSEDNPVPNWNNDWSFKQEIKLPISTKNPYSIFQPVDIHIEFSDNCWGKNENEHSIRVVCWDGEKWHELESQIYDLEKEGFFLTKCGIIFLVPDFADGTEKYFVYYDDESKPCAEYKDHVSVEDSYYYFEPISGIYVEGDYYKIIEDGYCVYGVGQKGEVLDRRLSQCVVKQKPKSAEFTVKNSDNIASFCFSYHHGVKDEDEISSDQILVAKDIHIDGNLMVEFRIVSESSDNTLRTSNIYKYYYCPTDNKRLNVHVKHEVLEDGTVKGIENVDGRYGAIFTYHSNSDIIQQMRFGKILPFLHVSGEDNNIREYQMNTDPEGLEREWIVPYEDDCDIGDQSWISYDEGEEGKAYAMIFESNKGLVKYGEDEKDGIQVKVAEKEILDILEAEIDYANINFGRNSYEKGEKHDLLIPSGLVVEYKAEFYTSINGGYQEVIEESKLFQTLVKYRQDQHDDSYDENQHIYTLTAIPRISGRILSHPILANLFGINITYVYGELYQNGKLISTGINEKPLLGGLRIKFPKLAKGEYVVKIFRKIGKQKIYFIGVQPVNISGDKRINVLCTWPKTIDIKTIDQNKNKIKDIKLFLYKNNKLIGSCISTDEKDTTINVPVNLFNPYILKAYYKGFKVFDNEIPRLKTSEEIKLELYDLKIKIEDQLGYPPGVNVRPFITSKNMDEPVEIQPDIGKNGIYTFKNIPKSEYNLQISYGGYSSIEKINIPTNQEYQKIKFNAMYSISNELLNAIGSPVKKDGKTIDILREEDIIFEKIPASETIILPPASYTLKIYSDNELIGIKTVELTNDKNIKIVTNIESIIPLLITILVIIFIGELVFLLLVKKLSLNTFLKLVAMSLILLSLFQPWWALNAKSNNPYAEKNTNFFIYPQTMIESLEYNGYEYRDLATIPEMFTNFVGLLFIIVCSGFTLIGISFIPNFLLKKRFSMGLIAASFIFLVLVVTAFLVGISKITEISLGSLQGHAISNVALPNNEVVCMNTSWGLGVGFYLYIIAALTIFAGGIIDILRKRRWPKQFFSKK